VLMSAYPQMEKNPDSTPIPVEGTPDIAARVLEFTPESKVQPIPLEERPVFAWRGLVKIVCFFGLIVILAFALNAIINSGLRRIKTSQFGVSNRMVQGKINANI